MSSSSSTKTDSKSAALDALVKKHFGDRALGWTDVKKHAELKRAGISLGEKDVARTEVTAAVVGQSEGRVQSHLECLKEELVTLNQAWMDKNRCLDEIKAAGAQIRSNPSLFGSVDVARVDDIETQCKVELDELYTRFTATKALIEKFNAERDEALQSIFGKLSSSNEFRARFESAFTPEKSD